MINSSVTGVTLVVINAFILIFLFCEWMLGLGGDAVVSLILTLKLRKGFVDQEARFCPAEWGGGLDEEWIFHFGWTVPLTQTYLTCWCWSENCQLWSSRHRFSPRFSPVVETFKLTICVCLTNIVSARRREMLPARRRQSRFRLRFLGWGAESSRRPTEGVSRGSPTQTLWTYRRRRRTEELTYSDDDLSESYDLWFHPVQEQHYLLIPLYEATFWSWRTKIWLNRMCNAEIPQLKT